MTRPPDSGLLPRLLYGVAAVASGLVINQLSSDSPGYVLAGALFIFVGAAFALLRLRQLPRTAPMRVVAARVLAVLAAVAAVAGTTAPDSARPWAVLAAAGLLISSLITVTPPGAEPLELTLLGTAAVGFATATAAPGVEGLLNRNWLYGATELVFAVAVAAFGVVMLLGPQGLERHSLLGAWLAGAAVIGLVTALAAPGVEGLLNRSWLYGAAALVAAFAFATFAFAAWFDRDWLVGAALIGLALAVAAFGVAGLLGRAWLVGAGMFGLALAFAAFGVAMLLEQLWLVTASTVVGAVVLAAFGVAMLLEQLWLLGAASLGLALAALLGTMGTDHNFAANVRTRLTMTWQRLTNEKPQ